EPLTPRAICVVPPPEAQPLSSQKLAGISDLPRERASRDRCGTRQKDLTFLMAHPTGKVAIGGADALQGTVHPPESIHWAAQTGRTAGVFRHLHTSVDEDLPDSLVAPAGVLQIADDLRGGWDTESINRHMPALQDPGKLEEVARLAARAGADVGPVQTDRG